MSVIQKLYPSLGQCLKDYIARPKENGYQSLHSTQLVPDSSTNGPPVVMEFQVTVSESKWYLDFHVDSREKPGKEVVHDEFMRVPFRWLCCSRPVYLHRL